MQTITSVEGRAVEAAANRYEGLREGRLYRKTTMDEDERPGELMRAIKRAQAGDDTAVRYLYLRFVNNVYGYARSLVRDDHDAEDIAQQAFVRMLAALPRYRPTEAPFAAWLLRIAHNLAIDHLRRKDRWRAEPVEATSTPPDDTDVSLTTTLRDALSELPDAQREVLLLRHVGGYAPGEIAERLDRTEDSIHGLHHRGRRALMNSLTQLGAAPRAA
jgi:RNA polymerase sigma-70 factor, ECF subfamily